MNEAMSAQPCGCDPGARWTCEEHRTKVADVVRRAQSGERVAQHGVGDEDTTSATRRRQIDSAVAGIANAIDLCEAAKLPELSDRLLSIQTAALKAREQA